LKGKCFGVAFGVAVFLLIAILMDWSELLLVTGLAIKETSAIDYEEMHNLSACNPSQGSFSGPLIPEKDNPVIDDPISVSQSDEKVPIQVWSSRAGFGISSSTDPEYWAEKLGSGWYIDWSVRTESQSIGLDHWQMIRVHEDCIVPSIDEIESAAARHPGQVWIIGNEPDVIWQDNVTAARYAAVYHDLYKIIKLFDQTAMIAVGGVSQATPLRLQYLDRVLQSYQALYHDPMPVDWWTVHGYVLREEKDSWGVGIPPGMDVNQGDLHEIIDHGRIDLFEAQLFSFRQWMADHGYQGTPLALTEFGILMPASYGFPSDVVASYLEQTFTWLFQVQDESIGYPEDGYHLVQKWAWFSISDPTYSSSNLGDLASGELTLVGERFRDTVSSIGP
jgi:hypothetical protein